MNELTSLATALGTRLKERKETIAIAESSAGGLISAALLAVPGASAYFLGGGVIYTQAARRGLLRVPDESVKGIRSSTEAYALLKARTIRELLGATWGLAETGASGPTGNRYGDAAGHACFAVTGPVERTSRAETEDYFAIRPRGAQLGAWASAQSQRVPDRAALEQAWAAAERRFPEEVPAPPHWGGYRLAPTSVEFWQGQLSRLHDRLRYRLSGQFWMVERLSP